MKINNYKYLHLKNSRSRVPAFIHLHCRECRPYESPLLATKAHERKIKIMGCGSSSSAKFPSLHHDMGIDWEENIGWQNVGMVRIGELLQEDPEAVKRRGGSSNLIPLAYACKCMYLKSEEQQMIIDTLKKCSLIQGVDPKYVEGLCKEPLGIVHLHDRDGERWQNTSLEWLKHIIEYEAPEVKLNTKVESEWDKYPIQCAFWDSDYTLKPEVLAHLIKESKTAGVPEDIFKEIGVDSTEAENAESAGVEGVEVSLAEGFKWSEATTIEQVKEQIEADAAYLLRLQTREGLVISLNGLQAFENKSIPIYNAISMGAPLEVVKFMHEESLKTLNHLRQHGADLFAEVAVKQYMEYYQGNYPDVVAYLAANEFKSHLDKIWKLDDEKQMEAFAEYMYWIDGCWQNYRPKKSTGEWEYIKDPALRNRRSLFHVSVEQGAARKDLTEYLLSINPEAATWIGEINGKRNYPYDSLPSDTTYHQEIKKIMDNSKYFKSPTIIPVPKQAKVGSKIKLANGQKLKITAVHKAQGFIRIA